MSSAVEHVVVGGVPTLMDGERPKIEHRSHHRNKCCATCTADVTGYERGTWLNSHREHVRCSCGAVTTKRGHGSHAAQRRRHGT